jgi:hypothetical protein
MGTTRMTGSTIIWQNTHMFRLGYTLGANTVGVGSWQRTDTCHDTCQSIGFARV